MAKKIKKKRDLSSLKPSDAKNVLWRKGILSWKLHALQKKIYNQFYNSDDEITTMLISRQVGKCIAEGTEVMTPTGPKNIEDLEIGEKIYGYNSDGSVSLTEVVAKEFQGEKEIIPLYNNGRLLAESTGDHRWLFYNTVTKKHEELKLDDAGSHKKIVTKYIDIPFGKKSVPHAYTLGALLGDGCSRQGIKQIHISSENNIIPKKVANILQCNYWRQNKNNYTWCLSYGKKGRGLSSKNTQEVRCEFYNEWCNNRYCQDKNIDIDEIRTWNRESILNLLAGLIDTDGSVFKCKTNNTLNITYSSNSIELIKAVQFMIHALVQYKPTIKNGKGDRADQYWIKLSNNMFSKRLLFELSDYLVLDRKKWKQEYSDLRENNQNENYIGIRKKEKYKKRTWDIQVNNDTNLYLLANGMVTHNSFLMSLIATETCIRKPYAVVKFVMPKQKSGKKVLKKSMRKILEDCPPDIRPEWKEADKIYLFPNGSEIQIAGTDNQNYDDIRGGTCLAHNTPILTDKGVKNIEDIVPGDYVYGYNKDGSISKTKVLTNQYMGKQKVTDIIYKGINVGAATDDHVFLTNSRSSVCRKDPKDVEKRFGDINTHNSYFKRKFVKSTGEVDEPHAYAIGAFIGDGCRTTRGNNLRISSKDNRIPKKIAETINCQYTNYGNYTYILTHNVEKYKHSTPVTFNYYNEWLKGENYLSKNFNFDVVNTWNRESCLKLLAGLHDTDGNLYLGEHHCDFEYTSCNLDLITNINKLLLKLFQIEGHIKIDNRSDIPCYKLKISSWLHVNRIVSELKNYGALSYKTDINVKYKRKENEEAIKITKGDSYITDTYDIMVDNDTNLYLTAHGLVTHNCDLWLVDEAGFCTDLLEVIYSVLIPTTTVTKGRGFLSSTPPPDDPEHPFLTHFVEKAQKEDRLFKYTLHDNPQLKEDDIQRIINKYIGGEKNPYFRAEYLCEIVRSDESMVVPEFSEEKRKEIVTDTYKRPPYYDYYVSMDIGGKDFTVALFGYYDFIRDIIVIEDEYVLEAKQNSGTIADGIINKKQLLYREKPPYLMFADNNNIILLNDLRKYHSLNFIPTKKDNKEASINTLRLLIQENKLIIHPRCKTLISHLSNVRWAKTRVNNYKKFAQSADGGHYDAVDACLYLIRNIKKSKNPYPSNFNQVSSSDHFVNIPQISKSAETFANIFKRKKN